MPASLHIRALAAGFGARPLFSGLDLIVGPGAVTAVVGANGAGKSTLLRIVAGEHPADSGSVRVSPPEATIGYLPQAVPRHDESLLEYAARRAGVTAAQEEFDSATAALAAGAAGAEDRYGRALERWLDLGSADLEARLGAAIAEVGLDVQIDRRLGTLSGGQAARAALASILVCRQDILLLDEPTNNLDAAGLATLTEFVRATSAPVLIASHDRRFLDEVATGVVELDEAQQAVNHYAGGWSDYRAARAQAREQAVAAYAGYVADRQTLVDRAQRQRDWAAKGRAKAADLGPGMQLAKKFKEDRARAMDQRAARSRAAADRLPEVEQPRKEWELRYAINQAPPSADVVLTLDGVVVRRDDFAVGPVSAVVARDDRVAILGENGSGKSTLLQAILGRIPLAEGRKSWGTRVVLGTLDQARDGVAGPDGVLDLATARLGMTDRGEVRTLLAKFGIDAALIDRPAGSLSLGERTRVALAILQGKAVNTLILDEPTNHLDVAAIEQLEAALGAFSGTVLIVTHDRMLLDALAPTTTWTCVREARQQRSRVEVRAES